jgi:uncharacterized protein YbjT (DUF2867 family)
MILITGATGTIGSEVVRLLALSGQQVRAMSRNPSTIPRLPGVEAVRGDFDDRDSLAKASAGATAVFLLTAPGPWIARQDEAMLAAAQAAGVGKAVKLSAIGTGEHAGASVGNWHLPGEQALRSSGMEWTVLRPSGFASNALRWTTAIRSGNPIPNTTGTGVQAVIDPRDVAEVAVRALTSASYAGRVLTLTGPELLSVPDLAGKLGAILGRSLTTADVPPEAYREQLLAAGVDADFAEVAVSGARLVAEGGGATITDEVRDVLGRPPRTFTTWVSDHRNAFAG